MSDRREPGVGPVRRALFQDVPFILDSMWRRWEFNVNRIGRVTLDDKNSLALRHGWLNGAFLLFIAVGAFCVLGPTLDAMCSKDDAGFAQNFRIGLGITFVVLSVFGMLFTFNASLERIRRQTELRADGACAADPDLQLRRERFTKVATSLRKLAVWVRPIGGAFAERFVGNTLRIAASLPFLGRWEILGLAIAAYVLFMGSIVLAMPTAALGADWLARPLDVESCTQASHHNYILAQAGALLALVGSGFWIWGRWGRHSAFKVFLASFAVLSIVISLLWKFAPDRPSESVGGFYPHLYVLAVAILLVTALAARWLARLMFIKFRRNYAEQYRAALKSHDLLHNEPDAPEVTGVRIGAAIVNGLESHLLHFLLLPAFVVFLAPVSAPYYTYAFAFVSAILVMYASLSKRLAQVLTYVDRWFLVGTPLVVSVLVIVIALARHFKVQYVTTVMDSAPMGVLAIVVIMCYAAVWFFEYWINRWLAEELLAIVGDEKQACRGHIECEKLSDSWAEPNGRYFAVHGTGRLCAHGWFRRRNPKPDELPNDLAFTTYGFAELFDVLAPKIDQGAERTRDIERRLSLYYNVINAFLIAAFIVAWSWLTPNVSDVAPMVAVKAIKSEVPSQETTPTQYAVEPGALPAIPAAPVAADPLANRLVVTPGESRQALVVAASGGGTRAAVYTAVALAGVSELDRTADVVLLSGVSGGGASSAMFASRYKALVATKPSLDEKNPWFRYVKATVEPYIEDVLEGIGEIRILREESLGVLLKESFSRRAFDEDVNAFTFGQLEGPSLILNSSISGHPYNDSQILFQRIAAPRNGAKRSCSEESRPYANLAGGRLIFTNLTNLTGFPKRTEDAPDMLLPYHIVNSGTVELAAASALTANFPPVFSNAHVWLDSQEELAACPRSYFVTDGGATENLGLASALFALRGTLRELPPQAEVADIHVLALEASAIDYDYSDDRGIGAATGGSKERINAGLTQMLLDEVRSLACAHQGELRVHYLPLPVAFRSRGGFGTHWMFAPRIEVSNPHLARQVDETFWKRAKYVDNVILDRPEAMRTLRAMFDTQELMCAKAARIDIEIKAANGKPIAALEKDGWTPDVQRVARWTCGFDDDRKTRAPRPDFQVEAWERVIQELGPAATRPAEPKQECAK
ncbi:MAG: patatin-like phospholipase family protein [Steroidobacteraceae bacterium]|nr:patatin-like phospholipase family protein [Steroidobacteraceae bacterium]